MSPSPSADARARLFPRGMLAWQGLDTRVADRFLELYRNRTIVLGFTVFISVIVLIGIDVVPRALATGSLVVGLQDRVALAYALLAALLGAWAWRLRQRAPRRRITPLCLATFLVALSFAVVVHVIGMETSISTPELYFVVVLLASAGLLPLPPARFSVMALPAVAVSAAVVFAADSPSPFVTAGLLAAVGSIAVVMAFLNFRRLKSMFESQLEAEDAVAERDQFLRILAHDLRGPVGVLPGFVSLIRQKAGAEPCGDVATELDVLESTARGIRSLLDNTLLWGKAREGSITPAREIVDSVAIVQALAESLGANAHLKEIDLVTDLPDSLPVLTDGELLRAVIRNLADNAIKFTEPGGTVSISGATEGENVVVRISDTGIGMATEGDQPRRAGTGGERGSGIGLGLVATLAERIGATVTFESTAGEGTLVEVSLPSGIEPAATPPTARTTPARRSRVWGVGAAPR